MAGLGRRLDNLWWRASRRVISNLARTRTELRWSNPARRQRPHGLPALLVVSLTSYPARFETLHLTLKCLLAQTVRADRIVLWVSKEGFDRLPDDVAILRSRGLDIRITHDIGPYTKIIPSLRTFPDAFLVTADDDVYYEPRWLQQLVSAYDSNEPAIICHRAHRVRADDRGCPLPYMSWDHEVPAPEKSPYLFPTGVGGVLYFPNALPAESLVEERFKLLSSRNDDLWLYWMERIAGLSIMTLGHRRHLINWPKSQRVGLFRTNTGSTAENDNCISRLFGAYGLPLEIKSVREHSASAGDQGQRAIAKTRF
jgi:hypothetical protein